MARDRADSAYGHALAVLADPDAATDTAVEALRRGGRSLPAVLGHARSLSLGRVGDPASAPPLSPDDRDARPADLTALARALASTRPPLERSLIDLDGRYGLDRAGVGHALGMGPSDAAARVAAVASSWQQELDPALMAWLGPGECPDAPSPPAATVGELLDAVPAVAGHVAGCELCQDRQRAMVSVQTLVNQVPLSPAPAAVRAAARSARRRRPATPPPLETTPRHHRRVLPVVAVVALLVVAATGLSWAAVRRERDQDARVREITKVRAGGLALAPALLGPSSTSAVLTNSSVVIVRWRATSSVAWFTLDPQAGALGPGARVTLHFSVSDSAPDGALHGQVTVTGDDGSVTAATIGGILNRPPTAAGASTTVP